MSKALNVKPSAQLRTLTLDAHQKILKAKKDNVTRWTSTMDMVRRYLRIKDELSACNGLEDYVLSGRENQVIKEAAKSFHTFNMITVEIQAKGMDLLDVREQFDTLLSHEKYKMMDTYLGQKAKIVESPDFEVGCIKVMRGEPSTLTEEEVAAIAKLKRKSITSNAPEATAELDVDQKLAFNTKRRKVKMNQKLRRDRGPEESPFLDIKMIVSATSNCCERLFSEAKYVMVPHRRGMSPILFESLLFLKKNVEYWNVKTVGDAIQNSKRDKRDDDDFLRKASKVVCRILRNATIIHD
ncbi:hypothetical protein IV203_005213 [Nitzschia inconspicua]|uniref:HAT C-terminal dimerisation domain-containing protein n=1 Tax=Nitzschia inconspicua TaxID=303405 RepID=A0A9K3KLY9_9STRA|nr:hypothetical protein IV203_005213 [Nitzschia inconspicua]